MIQREGGSEGSEGSDGSVVVQGEAQKGDVLACRIKRLARKLQGNGGITHYIHGHRPLGTLRRNRAKREQGEVAARGDVVGKR